MAVTVLAPGLSRKLKKVLETRTDSPDLLSSLATLSTFYADNTPQARRNLRSSIEQRALAINHHFLDASLSAQQVTDRVEEFGKSSARGTGFSLFFSLFFFSRFFFLPQSTADGRFRRYRPVVGSPHTGQLAHRYIPPDTGPYCSVRQTLV
ncbi:hypothetical protein GW17_00050850 [Ensete ventricosum]|nr:hypothetical protein GW17_00050850 [Ensete ventricosum]